MGKEELQSRSFAEKLLFGGSQVLHLGEVQKIRIFDKIKKILLLDQIPVRFQHLPRFKAEMLQ